MSFLSKFVLVSFALTLALCQKGKEETGTTPVADEMLVCERDADCLAACDKAFKLEFEDPVTPEKAAAALCGRWGTAEKNCPVCQFIEKCRYEEVVFSRRWAESATVPVCGKRCTCDADLKAAVDDKGRAIKCVDGKCRRGSVLSKPTECVADERALSGCVTTTQAVLDALASKAEIPDNACAAASNATTTPTRVAANGLFVAEGGRCSQQDAVETQAFPTCIEGQCALVDAAAVVCECAESHDDTVECGFEDLSVAMTFEVLSDKKLVLVAEQDEEEEGDRPPTVIFEQQVRILDILHRFAGGNDDSTGRLMESQEIGLRWSAAPERCVQLEKGKQYYGVFEGGGPFLDNLGGVRVRLPCRGVRGRLPITADFQCQIDRCKAEDMDIKCPGDARRLNENDSDTDFGFSETDAAVLQTATVPFFLLVPFLFLVH